LLKARFRDLGERLPNVVGAVEQGVDERREGTSVLGGDELEVEASEEGEEVCPVEAGVQERSAGTSVVGGDGLEVDARAGGDEVCPGRSLVGGDGFELDAREGGGEVVGEGGEGGRLAQEALATEVFSAARFLACHSVWS
jgi:hypothetical protein